MTQEVSSNRTRPDFIAMVGIADLFSHGFAVIESDEERVKREWRESTTDIGGESGSA